MKPHEGEEKSRAFRNKKYFRNGHRTAEMVTLSLVDNSPHDYLCNPSFRQSKTSVPVVAGQFYPPTLDRYPAYYAKPLSGLRVILAGVVDTSDGPSYVWPL